MKRLINSKDSLNYFNSLPIIRFYDRYSATLCHVALLCFIAAIFYGWLEIVCWHCEMLLAVKKLTECLWLCNDCLIIAKFIFICNTVQLLLLKKVFEKAGFRYEISYCCKGVISMTTMDKGIYPPLLKQNKQNRLIK